MTLHQLKVFVKVAEMQSFTQAAKALRLTQPSVSSLVQGLVDELKYKLFERRGMKVVLTPEGTIFLRRTREALAIIEETKDEIDEIHGLKKGKIRLGGAPIAAATFLPKIIQKFKKKYPSIEVVLKVQSTESLEKDLLEGNLDIGVLSWLPHSRLLISEPCYEEEFVVIAPPKHPLVKKRHVSLEHIAKERFIAPGKEIPVRKQLEETFAKKAISFTPAIEINTQFGIRDAIRNAVANGLGIGFIAKCHVTGDLKAGRVRVLHVPDLNLNRRLYIVVHKNQQNSISVRAFRDFLKARVKPQ